MVEWGLVLNDNAWMRSHFLLPEMAFHNLDDYRKTKGDALEQARRLSPQEILVELKASHLRGRGGGTLTAGVKWFTLFQQSAAKKYVVVNAAEGMPGAFKDRMIIRKNPYALLEGALIAAHVLHTKEVFIALKKSSGGELARLRTAISEFSERKLLNKVRVHLVAGPEDYLFGEEKALLNVIEGSGPFPREAHCPPYERGLFSTPGFPNPALVSNVETYARVPEIILRGAESFRSIGTDHTPGPLICTVSGDVESPGVYEVAAGTSLKDLLENHAGGPLPGHEFKIILSGVSARPLTKDDLDVKLTQEDFEAIGSSLDSCSFIVYDQTRSVPRIAQEVSKFLFKESCNQCTACKGGLATSSISFDALFRDNPDPTLIDRAVLGAKSAPVENRCHLPLHGSILIPSLVEKFRQEFTDLLEGKVPSPPPVTLPMFSGHDEKRKHFFLRGGLDECHFLGPNPDDWPRGTFFVDRGTF